MFNTKFQCYLFDFTQNAGFMSNFSDTSTVSGCTYNITKHYRIVNYYYVTPFCKVSNIFGNVSTLTIIQVMITNNI